MNKKGFLINDYLITLLVITILFNIIIQLFTIMGNYKFINYKIQDELMIYHIRKIMLLSNDITVSDKRLNFNYKNKEWYLYLGKDKLIMGQGVQVLLDYVDDINFVMENNIIYLEYFRDNQYYKRGIKKYDK